MQTSFKVGEKVRVRGHAEVGTVKSVGEVMIGVEYEPRPGTLTMGFYPPGHLEEVSEYPSPTSPPSLTSRETKPRASTKDILPPAPPQPNPGQRSG